MMTGENLLEGGFLNEKIYTYFTDNFDFYSD